MRVGQVQAHVCTCAAQFGVLSAHRTVEVFHGTTQDHQLGRTTRRLTHVAELIDER